MDGRTNSVHAIISLTPNDLYIYISRSLSSSAHGREALPWPYRGPIGGHLGMYINSMCQAISSWPSAIPGPSPNSTNHHQLHIWVSYCTQSTSSAAVYDDNNTRIPCDAHLSTTHSFISAHLIRIYYLEKVLIFNKSRSFTPRILRRHLVVVVMLLRYKWTGIMIYE